MVANQSACLANLATLFYILVVFSVGIFIGQKTFKSMLNNNFLFDADINGMDDDISVKYMRGGVNSSINRKLAAVHGNAIWGVIRNNEFWEEYKETNENDEEKLGADLRAQIAEKECFCGMRWDNQPGWYKGNCYHRPTKPSPVDSFRESVSAGNNLPINIINPAQFGNYKTREEERCALGGVSCGLEEEKIEPCSEADAFRCTRIDESYLEKYCIKCCTPAEMEFDEENQRFEATWDILCDDDPDNQKYAIVSGGQNFPAKDLHVFDGGYEFLFVKWRDQVVGDSITAENMDLVTCTWPWETWPWPKNKEGLTDEEKSIYDKNMQGFWVKLWVINQNVLGQSRRGVSKCTVEPIWEVQKPGVPCVRQEQNGCLYNERYTFYFERKETPLNWLLWIPIGMLVVGYCISAVVGYAGGWWGQWLDSGVGINFCPTWTK